MTAPAPLAVHMEGIVVHYPGGVAANAGASLAVAASSLHAVIGENGAGKTTLMHVLYGRRPPDRGRIRIAGSETRIPSAAAAIRLGIGMVSQHTTVVPALSVIENIILGAEPQVAGLIRLRLAIARAQAIAERLGIELPWTAASDRLSVAERQKAELVKALYRGARILILDEPTSALAPQEADTLFDVLRGLVANGGTVLLVTHKLQEVLAHAQSVTVLREGRTVAELATADTYAEELLALMLGQRAGPAGAPLVRAPDDSLAYETPWQRGPHSEMRRAPADPSPVRPMPLLECSNLRVRAADRGPGLCDVTLEVLPGEILGIAGIDGSGQQELVEAVVGLRSPASGHVRLEGEELASLDVNARRERGVTYIPGDRQAEGLVLDFSIEENLLLGRQRDRRFGGGRHIDGSVTGATAADVIRRHGIRAAGTRAPAFSLSGGNQQKLVVARALAGAPRLLVAVQPTRGLDVTATRRVHEALREAAGRGAGVLLVSLDLDEILDLSDRVAVLYAGRIAGVLDRSEADQRAVGRLMLGT